VKGFVADFEAALWQALKARFPRCPIQGCAFHWSQAVFRKVQEHGLQVKHVIKKIIINPIKFSDFYPYCSIKVSSSITMHYSYL
jgi:transposase-like protein